MDLESEQPLDRRVMRALRREYAAPSDPRYWRRLEAKVMWRVATAAGDEWVRAFRSWQRIWLYAAAVALVTLGISTWRERVTERQIAYETAIMSRAPLPVQLRERLIDGSVDEATLRYVYGY
jgi:hypothetical protein